jgi:hypothetical protein
MFKAISQCFLVCSVMLAIVLSQLYMIGKFETETLNALISPSAPKHSAPLNIDHSSILITHR